MINIRPLLLYTIMTLHEELENLDEDVVGKAFADVITVTLFEPEEATAIDRTIDSDYTALAGIVDAAQDILEGYGTPERDAHLVAGGMKMAIAILKSCAERQLVEEIDLSDPETE